MTSAGGDGHQNKKWMLIGVLAIIAISVAGWCRLHVDTSIEPLLPENSEAKDTLLFVRDSSFASKAILWFSLRDGASIEQLYAAADAAEKKLDPALIKRVVHPPAEADAMDEAMGMLDHPGELLNEQDLSEVKAATTPVALQKRMRDCYMQLAKPEGSFMQDLIRKDPLGVSARILNRLYALTNGMGYKIQVKDGRFMHPDGRQMMMMLETSSTATSLEGSRALVANLNQIANQAPEGVVITPICSQVHTTENQRLMESDTRRGGIINTVVFILLFLLVSRDWRVAAIFLLPVASIAITIGLCALVYPNLSMMMIGVSVTMAGSAVDYGIFVYTAVSMGKDRAADMRRIRMPLIISHLTTLGVFLAFLFSSIPAYRQLGYLTSISLVLSLLAALFLLPKFIRPGGKILLLGSGMPLTHWGRYMVPATYFALLVFIIAVKFSMKTSFDPDISRLDGVGPIVKQAEDNFQKAWGRSDVQQGILVVTGRSKEQAEETNDKIFQMLTAPVGQSSLASQLASQFVSMSAFYPSAATRQANLARWQQFWSPAQVNIVRRDLVAAGEPYGFAADAFDPFFTSLSQPPAKDSSNQILSAIEDIFVARAGSDYEILNYFPDTAENTKIAREMVHGMPGVQIVSRRALGQAFADAARSETKLLVGVSSAFIVLFLLLLTRSPIKSLIIMLPSIAGLAAMLAVLAAMSLSMNVVTVIAAIIVLALTSDYGVFAVYAWQNRERLLGQGMASVHLCAITTAVGTGAMLLAHHPALFQVGVSLTTGLVAGYATSIFVIPGILYLMDRSRLSALLREA